MRFDLESYAAWRCDHPNDPLHRDVESWMALEIEWLREEVAMLQQEARIRKNICDGLASEADAERAAVVAYLREPGTSCDKDVLADMFERGEHRREEEGYDPSDAWRFCEGCGCCKQTARARSWSDHSWCDDCTSRE